MLARYLLEHKLALTLTLMPLVMGLVVAGLVLFGQQPMVAAVLVAFWGMTFGVVQVGWPTWLTRTIPDETESGGGLQIATIQLAITAGAAAGGLLFDLTGATGVFMGSSAITLLAALIALLAFRTSAKPLVETSKPAEKVAARHSAGTAPRPRPGRRAPIPCVGSVAAKDIAYPFKVSRKQLLSAHLRGGRERHPGKAGKLRQ